MGREGEWGELTSSPLIKSFWNASLARRIDPSLSLSVWLAVVPITPSLFIRPARGGAPASLPPRRGCLRRAAHMPAPVSAAPLLVGTCRPKRRLPI